MLEMYEQSKMLTSPAGRELVKSRPKFGIYFIRSCGSNFNGVFKMLFFHRFWLFCVILIFACSCTKQASSDALFLVDDRIHEFAANHKLSDSVYIEHAQDTINIVFIKSESDTLIFERYDLNKFNLLYCELYEYLNSNQVVLMEQRYSYTDGIFYKSFTKDLDSNMVYKYYLENAIFKSASEYILDSMKVSDILSFQSLIDVSNGYYEDFKCVGSIIDLTALYSLEVKGGEQSGFAEVRLRTMGAVIKLAEPEGALSDYLNYIFNLTKDGDVDPNYETPLTIRK